MEAGEASSSPGVGDRSVHAESVVAGRSGGLVTDTGDPNGFLPFAVPAPLDAPNPRMATGDGATVWWADEPARERLATPSPQFALETLDVPDSVTQPTNLDLSLTVSNERDVDGRFLAAVNWPTRGIADDDETTVLERSVAAGATESFSLSLDTEYAVTETDTLSLTVSGCVEAERTVEVVAADG